MIYSQGYVWYWGEINGFLFVYFVVVSVDQA